LTIFIFCDKLIALTRAQPEQRDLKNMSDNIAVIHYEATSTALTASTTAISGNIVIPYIFFQFVFAIVCLTLITITIYLHFKQEKN